MKEIDTIKSRISCRISKYILDLAAKVPNLEPREKTELKFSIPKNQTYQINLMIPESLTHTFMRLEIQENFKYFAEITLNASTITEPKKYPPIPGPAHEYTVPSTHTSPEKLINQIIHTMIYYNIPFNDKKQVVRKVDDKYLQDDPIKCKSYYKSLCTNIYEAMR